MVGSIRRYTIALGIGDNFYKVASLFLSQHDASFFLYLHCINEDAAMELHHPIHLLSTKYPVNVDKSGKRLALKGSEIHISLHPEEMHTCRRKKGSKSELLTEPYIPMKFGNGYRLLCFFTSMDPSALPKTRHRTRKYEYLLQFKWPFVHSPMFSIYEVATEPETSVVDHIDPKAVSRVLVEHLGRRLLITCKETSGDAGIWMSNFSVFGTPKHPKPMTKTDLQRSLDAHELPYKFDISSLPDDASITSVRLGNE